MLRYDRQSKPGLVALYDIRPGNGAGPFLQPWSPHGAQPIHGSVSAKVENIGCKYSQLECVHAEEPIAEIYFIPATLTSSKKNLVLTNYSHTLIVMVVNMPFLVLKYKEPN